MNTFFSQRLFFPLAFLILSSAANSPAAIAQALDYSKTDELGSNFPPSNATNGWQQAIDKNPAAETIPTVETPLLSGREISFSTSDPLAMPPLETSSTSAGELIEPAMSSALPESNPDLEGEAIAQRDIRPGRATRSGYSYVGLGVNIGLDTEGTALGDGSFALYSKIGLTRQFSVRPTILIGGDAVILVPVTIDFPPRETLRRTSQLNLAPYLGGGLAISTGDSSSVGGVISAGIDSVITRDWTATFGINAGVFDGDFELGLLLGAGYNF